MPALYGDNILRLRYLQRTFLQIQFKSRFLHHRPQVMPGLHPEHIHPGEVIFTVKLIPPKVAPLLLIWPVGAQILTSVSVTLVK